ncbi:MAG: carboxylating nicotinate-nucleotide diphosphorylase [Porticoccaceae bacterium]|nr:carboxylating nicotinate-nucleotide diphosphorylase [Porticoccaceae bacterium]
MNIDPELQQDISDSVTRALTEDIGSGDITAQLIPAEHKAQATIVTREDAVACGIPWVDAVFAQLDPGIEIDWAVSEGDDIQAGQTLCTLTGKARSLLTGERAALNFLQTLSGTATVARHYAELVTDSGITILDTRKTLPGLRLAQKYAVHVGGCQNHRMGLYDAFLIKENHIAACGGIQQAVERARVIAPGKPVEIEVENLEECQQALSAGAERIMLDNFSLPDVTRAVALRDNQRNQQPGKQRTELEVSGNIEGEAIGAYRNSGIDFISSGALTKHLKATDYSMRITSSPNLTE